MTGSTTEPGGVISAAAARGELAMEASSLS